MSDKKYYVNYCRLNRVCAQIYLAVVHRHQGGEATKSCVRRSGAVLP
jgi:hypothetical protein